MVDLVPLLPLDLVPLRPFLLSRSGSSQSSPVEMYNTSVALCACTLYGLRALIRATLVDICPHPKLSNIQRELGSMDSLGTTK